VQAVQNIEASGTIRQTSEEFTATTGQTVFTLTTTTFAGEDTLAVYVNGVRQSHSAYTTSSTNVITFSEGLQDGDKVLFTVNESTSTTLTASQISGLTVNTIADLPSESNIDQQAVVVSDENHGGTFIWEANVAKTEHNGGTIIDPDVDMTTWTYTSANAGNGVWRRQYNGSSVNVKWFGAIGDGVSDDSQPFKNSLESHTNLEVSTGHYKLNTWTEFLGNNDIALIGTGKPHIEGAGYSGAGTSNFISSGGNIHIEGIKFSNFVSVCASLPSNLNDYFKFLNNDVSDTLFSINLNVTTVGGGYRDIFVNGNIMQNTSYGAWIVPREMHNTIVTNNVFKNLGNTWGSANNVQAVMIGLSTQAGTRLNANVSNNIFQSIVNTGTGETTAIMMHDVLRCTVNDNVINQVSGGAGEGIYLRQEYMDATCTGNVIKDVEKFGIAVKNGKSVISNNRISGFYTTPLFGIGQAEGLDHVIDGNWVSNCVCGIYNLSPITSTLQSRVEISNNVITDCLRVGIYASGRSRSQVITNNKVKRITGGALITDPVFTGRIIQDINVGIDTSFTGNTGRCVVTNNHVSEVKGDSTGSGDGLESVAYRLRIANRELYAQGNSLDAVEYGFFVENLVHLQNNFLGFYSLGLYHPSSNASSNATLQAYLSTGITFPSDNSAAVSDANTLDAYEEGEWTPSFGRSSVFGSYTPNEFDNGKYTRIGNVVYWSCRVGGTNTTASGGQWIIRGLPFTCVDNFNGRVAANVQGGSGTLNSSCHVIENSNDVACGTLVSGATYYASGFYFIS
jgi:hypothetical protein